jgi:S1-C subfamily serine protease
MSQRLFILPLLAVVVMLAVPIASNAQMPGQPENSWVQGSNWYCHKGYKKSGNQCISIFAHMPGGKPEHSWVQGSNWYCHKGYKKSGNQCISIFAHMPGGKPEHSWVQGSNWYCHKGYKKSGSRCVSIFANIGRQSDKPRNVTRTPVPKNASPSREVQKELEKLRRENARLKKEKARRPKPQPYIARRNPSPQKRKSPPPKSATSGSGFFVSKLGHVITNQHVVKNCRSVTVGDSAKKQVTAIVLETDNRNDLALLRISNMEMASVQTKTLVAKLGMTVTPLASQGLLRPGSVELGEDVVVAGFPFGDLYSNTIKITKGVVSAKRGLGDDTGKFQIDAAVQPGNSGGPIYAESGNIIGVVVSQLNKLKVAKAIGSLPENVNFGIKASTVKQFLNASGLPSSWSKRTKRMSTKDIAKIAESQTVMVVCHR